MSEYEVGSARINSTITVRNGSPCQKRFAAFYAVSLSQQNTDKCRNRIYIQNFDEIARCNGSTLERDQSRNWGRVGSIPPAPLFFFPSVLLAFFLTVFLPFALPLRYAFTRTRSTSSAFPSFSFLPRFENFSSQKTVRGRPDSHCLSLSLSLSLLNRSSFPSFFLPFLQTHFRRSLYLLRSLKSSNVRPG